MKTKLNTKKKVSTKPKSKALKQGAVKLSLPNMQTLVEKNIEGFGMDYYEAVYIFRKGANAMRKEILRLNPQLGNGA